MTTHVVVVGTRGLSLRHPNAASHVGTLRRRVTGITASDYRITPGHLVQDLNHLSGLSGMFWGARSAKFACFRFSVVVSDHLWGHASSRELERHQAGTMFTF